MLNFYYISEKEIKCSLEFVLEHFPACKIPWIFHNRKSHIGKFSMEKLWAHPIFSVHGLHLKTFPIITLANLSPGGNLCLQKVIKESWGSAEGWTLPGGWYTVKRQNPRLQNGVLEEPEEQDAPLYKWFMCSFINYFSCWKCTDGMKRLQPTQEVAFKVPAAFIWFHQEQNFCSINATSCKPSSCNS